MVPTIKKIRQESKKEKTNLVNRRPGTSPFGPEASDAEINLRVDLGQDQLESGANARVIAADPANLLQDNDMFTPRKKTRNKKTNQTKAKNIFKKLQKEDNKPFVDPSIGLFGLASNGTVDQKVLGSLVRPDQVNLALEGRGLVELSRKTIGS